MNVSQRLSALRRQAGASESTTSDIDDRSRALADLRARIARMRTRPASCRSAPTMQRDDGALACLLGGEIAAPGIVRLCERIERGTRHGAEPLDETALATALGLLAGDRAGRCARGIVFMDTETTGLAGGTGTLVFLLGLARFAEDGLEVSQLLLSGFHGEQAFLELARGHVRAGDALVTFNGRSFDAPLLAARFRLAGLADPFAALEHVDLLHATRRAFASSWPDCRLQTAEQRLLDFARHDDLPGAEVPLAWFDWVRDGRPDRLARACVHNRDDLVSLAALATALARVHLDPLHAHADAGACARFLASVGEGEHAYRYLRAHRARLDARAGHELARLARRRGERGVALETWQALAARGDAHALEALAKYYEHEARDLHRALELTRTLVAGAPASVRHRHRQSRLLARLARAR